MELEHRLEKYFMPNSRAMESRSFIGLLGTNKLGQGTKA